jgi:GNAT superfamily N-acetyltransferase
MPREAAREYWRGATQQLAAGKRAILAAWLDGALAGTVTLDLAFPQNQPRRAQVEKLLVEPPFRRRGVGRALLARAEQAAARLGRRGLTLDTREGVPAEALYRAAGWVEAGRIPASELDEEGRARDVLVFWKEAS